MLAGFLSVGEINSFDSRVKNEARKAKQKPKAHLLRREKHAMPLRAGDSFHNAPRHERNSASFQQNCYNYLGHRA